ncbi:unnamed protein product [Fraxinus pennsylvanica]|uniref:Uncharacterized protein n=1 Tax=Fraxinus pennsylvanica TaxID=56036 RepID=A0AAD1ZKD7_9LAMI|nr:unnamed protein product [Fraxinus pennsylvanica]
MIWDYNMCPLLSDTNPDIPPIQLQQGKSEEPRNIRRSEAAYGRVGDAIHTAVYYIHIILKLACPSMADTAELAHSSDEKFTNPNPLDFPVSLSMITLAVQGKIINFEGARISTKLASIRKLVFQTSNYYPNE